MDRSDLQKNPFFLDDAACDWVMGTLAAMTQDEKIGQVFCPTGSTAEDPAMRQAVEDYGVGGMMTMPARAESVQALIRYAQQTAKIPLLFAANLESGGKGLVQEGTEYGTPSLLAATGNREAGYRLGKICGAEAGAIGSNWSFAPIVDLDLNYRSPVVNNRSFGSRVDTVIEIAGGYLKAAKEENIAVSVKHFPGDGSDDWDHHYEPSTNRLSFEEWDASYGNIYRAMFAQGALTTMIGHIALPAYVREVAPDTDPYAPATLSPVLLQKLLRGHLGFNGMVVTDSNNMLAFLTYMPRHKAVPYCLAAGCDMILFNKSLCEDIGFLKAGLAEGIVTQERLEEAVMRILATKAALGLHRDRRIRDAQAAATLGNPTFAAWAKETSEQGITLVKDTQNMLPLTPQRYPRLYLNVLQEDDDPHTPLRREIKALFENAGFHVTLRDRTQYNTLSSSMEENNRGVAEMTGQFDAAVYVAQYNWGDELAMHLSWRGFHARGNDAPWFTAELPTLFISLAHPYYLADVPMMKTYINTYGRNAYTLDVLMEKLAGRQPFTGTPPADPFCGRPETRV